MSEESSTGPREFFSRFGGRHIRYLWLVGLAFFIAVVWYLGWRDLADALSTINLRFIFALMAVETLSLWLRAWKWRLALGPVSGVYRACFISKAGGNLSPARVGEFSPLLLPEHRSAQVGAWIVTDRLIEIAATLILGLAGLLALGSTEYGFLAVWMGLGALVIAAAGFALTRRSWFEKGAAFFKDGSLPRKGLAALASVSGEMGRFSGKMPLLAVLTLITKSMDVAVGLLLYGSFGHWAAFQDFAVAQCVHALTTIIPFAHNATGIPYAAAATFLHETAGIPTDILVVAVPVRIAAASIVFWSSFGIAMATFGSKKNGP